MSETRNLKQEIDVKLHDPVLRDALGRFADQYPESRLRSYANVDSIEDLRDDLKEMKHYAVTHIEELADEFEGRRPRLRPSWNPLPRPILPTTRCGSIF